MGSKCSRYPIIGLCDWQINSWDSAYGMTCIKIENLTVNSLNIEGFRPSWISKRASIYPYVSNVSKFV